MVLYKSSSRQHTLFFIGIFLFAFLIYALANPASFQVLFIYRSTSLFTWAGLWLFITDYGHWLLVIYLIAIAFLLFFENRNPDRTLAWLLALALFPVFGLLLYWFVGPNFRYAADKRRLHRPGSIDHKAHKEQVRAELPSLGAFVASVIYHCSGAKLEQGCDVALFTDGSTTFARIEQALREAQHCIFLASYILRDDDLGNSIREILEERARAGVHVCLMYDAVGSWRMGRSFVASLRAAGVHVFPFLPVSFPMFRGANYRNHRKILVIDGTVGFTGGYNIGNEYLGRSPRFGYWRDTHMEVRGPAVHALTRIFLKDLHVCGTTAAFRKGIMQGYQHSNAPVGTTTMQITASGPDCAWDTIRQAYVTLLSRAERRAWVTTPYLIPDDALINALCTAALSGVDVRILIPAKADHILVHWASLHSCSELLRAGVRIFLYREDRFIHAKTMVCDGSVYTVGSANMDTRSLHINFEVQAFVYDAELARQAEVTFLHDLEEADEILFSLWLQRSFVQRIKENIGKLFSSLA